jgi:hypothetical protein
VLGSLAIVTLAPSLISDSDLNLLEYTPIDAVGMVITGDNFSPLSAANFSK